MNSDALSIGGGANAGPVAVTRPVVRLDFPGLTGPILLWNADPVRDGLARALRGWHPAVSTVPHEGPAEELHPLSTVIASQNERYSVLSAHMDAPLPRLPAASAVCGVIADLAQGWCAAHPEALVLHCGAFGMGGRLIAMTGPARMGKSTLVSRLTAEPDLIIFNDDVLPVLPDGLGLWAGLALGFSPRLRLPLPDGVSDAFRAHVAANLGPHDPKYAYVTAPNIAPHGTRLPLDVILVLDRRAQGPARFEALSPAEAVRHLVKGNFARQRPSAEVFDQISAMANGLTCLRLVYSDLDDAAALLRRDEFVASEPAAAENPPISAEPAKGTDKGDHAPRDLSAHWHCRAGLQVRRIDDDMFLCAEDAHRILHLNPVGAAIWELLGAGLTGQQITAELAEVFPDVPAEVLAADVAALVRQLRQHGLIRRA